MSKKDNSVVIGLDIGTTKICAIVGEITDNGIDIIGIGHSASKGLRKGVVVNIEATVQSIKKAVEEAEIMSGREIREIYAGIAGGHIRGLNSHGVIAVKDGEVKEADMKRVIDAACAVAIPMDREVIHIIPQEFIIDGQDGIKEPLGMSGVRLEANVHIVTGAVASAQNIVKCANRAGLDVSDIILEPLASADAVLTADEKELGVALVDIGGGTSDVAVFYGGSIKYTSVISVGGNHITNDIAVGLRTPTAEADRIKHRYGCAMGALVKKDEMIEVPAVAGREARTLARQMLAEFIEPRVEEILELVRHEILKSGYGDLLAGGIVLTGGSSILEGLPELAEQIFGLSVRRGIPQYIGGLRDVVNSPMYATSVGLVLYGAKQQAGRNSNGNSKFKIRDEQIYDRLIKRMRGWFTEFFGL
jgi:cell division protein FtsA